MNTQMDRLLDCMRAAGPLAVAFSGGVDSSVTLWVLSDGRENVSINIDGVSRIDVSRALNELRRAKAIPALPNVEV